MRRGEQEILVAAASDYATALALQQGGSQEAPAVPGQARAFVSALDPFPRAHSEHFSDVSSESEDDNFTEEELRHWENVHAWNTCESNMIPERNRPIPDYWMRRIRERQQQREREREARFRGRAGR